MDEPNSPATNPDEHPLSELERAILEFERRWWRQAGAKESAIRAEFGLSTTRYYQVLNRLLDSPDALATAPTVVARLRRLRGAGSANGGED